MNTRTEKKVTQPTTPQRSDKASGFGKSPSGFPEEPRALQTPDKRSAESSTPAGSKPVKEQEPNGTKGKEITGQKHPHPEEQDRRDTQNTGKAWNPATNPDEHGTAQQKKNLKDGSTTPDPTEEEETTDPGRRAPEREGQQEQETQLPETPPSEWEVKSTNKTPDRQTNPEAKEQQPDKKARPEQDNAQDKQRRGL